ncbi:methionyl-tRNA formyltransferase [Calothrix sp. PCC 6303]|uniref:methionyl-tRNA formyltransferase n=1 Tax=Calothrix sp. PCC 6303 TaxID=1170562 RepID=UPI0002A04B12|nr:methionyl-tRNA formyltransferase [Calothrix sp. PCC 6303]AFZ02769.1 methionyl-tRNA formyltransferase [Calothrix sp. PCC 6303]
MKVVFFGTPDFAVLTLERLVNHPNVEVVAAVTQPDKRRERGNQLIPSAIKKLALNYNIPILQPARIKKDEASLTQLQEYGVDAFVVVAYGQILSQRILDMPKLGCINVHGSILPQYRGAAPIQWCLHNGEAETGITTMLMDAGMDTGAMLLKATTPISLLDNTQTLAERLALMGADLLIDTLFKLESGEIIATPQDNSEATYAPLIQKQDYSIDWSKSALQIHNQIRGFYPNCVTTFRQQPLKVTGTLPFTEINWSQLPKELQELENRVADLSTLTGKVGEVVSIIKGMGAVIQTGLGHLLLREVQPAGKRSQSGWDFVNGVRITVGELLGS